MVSNIMFIAISTFVLWVILNLMHTRGIAVHLLSYVLLMAMVGAIGQSIENPKVIEVLSALYYVRTFNVRLSSIERSALNSNSNLSKRGQERLKHELSVAFFLTSICISLTAFNQSATITLFMLVAIAFFFIASYSQLTFVFGLLSEESDE